MKLIDFIKELNEYCKKVPDAEVLVNGWPAFTDCQPSYYDGPSKIYDEVTNTVKFTRSGSKIVLRSLTLEDLAEMHPDLKLDTSELPNWQAEQWKAKLDKALVDAKIT